MISCIITTATLACIIFIPTNLGAGCLFSVVMFQWMPKCGNNCLCFQNCSAYRAMLSLCESRGCACWINRIVYHFNVIACVFLPFHVNVNVFGQSRCLQGFKRSAYCQFSIEIVANDMISVFRYGRNIGGDIPNNIILSVVRVYGYFKTWILRVDFIARSKNARQNDCHCQNGENAENTLLLGFHVLPRSLYCRDFQ